jgi:hypothetical protein
MKPAWKELLIAINGAFLFLLILLATEIALSHPPDEGPERDRAAVQADSGARVIAVDVRPL